MGWNCDHDQIRSESRVETNSNHHHNTSFPTKQPICLAKVPAQTSTLKISTLLLTPSILTPFSPSQNRPPQLPLKSLEPTVSLRLDIILTKPLPLKTASPIPKSSKTSHSPTPSSQILDAKLDTIALVLQRNLLISMTTISIGKAISTKSTARSSPQRTSKNSKKNTRVVTKRERMCWTPTSSSRGTWEK